MVTGILVGFAVFFTLTAALTYTLLILAMRRSERQERADLDAELQELIEQHG